jgi:transposase
MPHRLKITPEGMQALLERLRARAILADDYELIIAIMEAHVLLDTTLAEKQGTVMKLLRMLFGARTEKKKPCCPIMS